MDIDKVSILRPTCPTGSVAANSVIKLVVLQDIIKELTKRGCYKRILTALLKDNYRAYRKEANV